MLLRWVIAWCYCVPLSHVLHVINHWILQKITRWSAAFTLAGRRHLHSCLRHSCNAGQPTRDILRYPMINLYLLISLFKIYENIDIFCIQSNYTVLQSIHPGIVLLSTVRKIRVFSKCGVYRHLLKRVLLASLASHVH